MGGDVVLERGEAGAAHERSDRACRRLDRHHRGGDPLRIGLGLHIGGEGRVVRALRRSLRHRVESGSDAEPTAEHRGVALVVGRPHARVGEELLLDLFDEVALRRRLADRAAPRRPRALLSGASTDGKGDQIELIGLRLGELPGGDETSERGATPLCGGRRMQDRIELDRVGDDRCQQRPLGPGEVLHVLAPVGLGSRLDAIGTLAEIDGVEVQLEDVVLAHLLFEADGERDLLGLATEVPIVGEQCLLDQLLRDGGTALIDTAGADILHERPHQPAQVDTGMVEELGVLDGQHRLDHRGWDVGQRHRIAVLGAVQRGDDRAVRGEDLRAHRIVLEL